MKASAVPLMDSHSATVTHVRLAPTRTPRRAPAVSRDLGVIGQVRHALHPRALLATITGFLLGGFVPLASFWLSHRELDHGRPVYLQLTAYIVAGGLLYSAKTVYAWGKLAFHTGAKALGFVVLLEGVMILSHTPWLTMMALAYLVVINGVATGCNLALPRPQQPGGNP
jgi:hypothetical protein